MRVPKIQSYINNFNHLEFPEERLNEVTRKFIEPCSADAYVLINQPGVTLDDLQNYESFKFLRTYSFMSSTLGAIPRAAEPIDFDNLASIATSICGASYIEINNLDEVETYLDTGKRVIRINFPKLPPKEEREARIEALKIADETLRKTLRKLPSPNHSVIYTSLESSPYINKLNEKRWSGFTIFEDISRDASRDKEFERNDNVVAEERKLPEKRNNILKRDQLNDINRYIDTDLILENEFLVLGISFSTSIMIIYFVVTKLFKIIRFVISKSTKSDERKKNK
ncbi:hypothetical protein WICMUC_004370 [Wickerhamomyces mucosus]|uniref:Protein BIG1 n=1 Tax=Wickerhamomyces mucosus TaxID=1378264 RepID=A0A9P8TBD0_9ASCO|nr:hypothetical protein WICMUC_004370 [Wickerhamomyces mucosus]